MTDEHKTFYQQELERIAAAHLLPEYQYIQVRQSRRFMENYHSEKIQLADLAAAAFMSRFHYIRVFRQVYGVSPRQYLKDLRMTKAKELIKAGATITQTCFEVGYESLPTFSSNFKRSTGFSPNAYRKLHNSNPE